MVGSFFKIYLRERKMLKALLAGRGAVAVVATNGVVSAACGCGSRNPKDYDFVSQVAGEQSFSAPQSLCDCGGTREKCTRTRASLRIRNAPREAGAPQASSRNRSPDDG